MREVATNLSETALADDVDDTQTVIEVNDGSVFPASGHYRLMFGPDGETLHCTGRTGNNLTVVRGIEGTTAVSRLAGTPVRMIYTVGGVNRLFADNVSLWGRQPVMGIYADDGSVLTASSFTWLNQGSTTAVDQGRSILMTVPPASGTNMRGLLRSAPSTPYSYQAAFRQVGFRQGNTTIPYFGVGFRQSSSGRFVTATFLMDAQSPERLAVINWTDPTSSGSEILSRSNWGVTGSELWVRWGDDGTNLTFHLGDGLNWFQIYSVSRTAHLTVTGPDQIMWLGSNFNSGSAWPYLVRLCHWSRHL